MKNEKNTPKSTGGLSKPGKTYPKPGGKGFVKAGTAKGPTKTKA